MASTRDFAATWRRVDIYNSSFISSYNGEFSLNSRCVYRANIKLHRSLKTSISSGGRSYMGRSSHISSNFYSPALTITPRFDHEERTRKRLARESHKQSDNAQKFTGLRAKLYQKKRHAEKIQMKKQIKAHEERNVKSSAPAEPSSTPLPQYLLDRSQPTNAKALSSAIKNKRAEKAAKFSVPLPKVRGIAEEEMFKVVKTGKKTAKKGWKRMITKPTFGMLYSTLRRRLNLRTYWLIMLSVSWTGLYPTAY